MKDCPHSRVGDTWNVLLSAYRILASSEAPLDHYGFCLLRSPLALWSECHYVQEAGWWLVTRMTATASQSDLNPEFSTYQLCDPGYNIEPPHTSIPLSVK